MSVEVTLDVRVCEGVELTEAVPDVLGVDDGEALPVALRDWVTDAVCVCVCEEVPDWEMEAVTL